MTCLATPVLTLLVAFAAAAHAAEPPATRMPSVLFLGDKGHHRPADRYAKVVEGVLFALVDPQGDRQPNAIMLGGSSGRLATRMPRSVTLPVNATARAIHPLSGVAGLGYPAGREGTVSMRVRIRYDDGTTEDHELKNGMHFADVNGGRDVPGSRLAFRLGRQQVRYLTVTPGMKDPIASIELAKGRDQTAPIVLAATVEGFE